MGQWYRAAPRCWPGSRLRGAPSLHLGGEMSTPLPEPTPSETLELPVAELLRRARPLPPYGEMVIDDLTPEEADAFLAAVHR